VCREGGTGMNACLPAEQRMAMQEQTCRRPTTNWSGRPDAACDNMPSCIGQIRDGKLRPLAVTSAERAHALPDVPTFAEAGVRDAEATGWFGIQAPSRTPRAIIERVGRELDVVTRDPTYRARINELGGNPPNLKPDGGTTPEAYELSSQRKSAAGAR
jgi:tripartite-type tricarboxylate transporter receptor subunit TctC